MKKIIKKYNDNKTIKINKETHIKVYKCCFLDCDQFFFDKKNLNDHTMYKHSQMPITYKITPNIRLPTIFFDRDRINILNKKIQKQMIKHTLLVIGINVNKIKKPVSKKITKWFNDKKRTELNKV